MTTVHLDPFHVVLVVLGMMLVQMVAMQCMLLMLMLAVQPADGLDIGVVDLLVLGLMPLVHLTVLSSVPAVHIAALAFVPDMKLLALGCMPGRHSPTTEHRRLAALGFAADPCRRFRLIAWSGFVSLIFAVGTAAAFVVEL